MVQTAVQQLCEFLERGNGDLEPHEREMRQLLVTMLNKLPFVCRALIADATADVRFVYVMFYERVRMGASGGGFFLEAVGRGLPLLTGHAPVVLPQAQVRATTYGQSSRTASRRSRGSVQAGCAARGSRPSWRSTGSTTCRPRSRDACKSLCRARSLAQGLLAAKPASCFAQCATALATDASS